MGGIYNLSPALQELAHPAIQVMALYPLLMGAQALMRGVLIRGGCTGTVRSAMAVNVLTLTLTIVAGVLLLDLSGVMVAAIAVLVGGLAELAWLYWKGR
jgi:hypothetical protein